MVARQLGRPGFRLQAAINRYIAEHNADPKPFTWTKTAEQIMNNLHGNHN